MSTHWPTGGAIRFILIGVVILDMVRETVRQLWVAVGSKIAGSATQTEESNSSAVTNDVGDGESCNGRPIESETVNSDPSHGTLDTSSTVADGGMAQPDRSELPGDGIGEPLHDQKLIAAMGVAAFTIDADRRVVSWNEAMTELSGVPPEEVIGTKNAIGALYEDNQPPEKAKTLAGWILEAPQTADTHFEGELPYEIERVESNHDEPLYRIETRIAPRGGERVVRFYAAPIYRDGELVRVIETAHDRTEEVQRHEAMTGLVDEVTKTLQDLRSGRLDARASFEDGRGHVDDRLLNVVTELNETASDLEGIVTQVDETADELESTGTQVSEAVGRIDDHTRRQSDRLSEVLSELQEFSVRMEEVASTAEEISAQAQDAEDATETGVGSGKEAQEAIDAVVETSDQLIDQIGDLEAELDEIEEIVEIIDGVADQTNMLALNANIEAARADGSGDGFAVVADEIKELAEETSDHTDEITESIEAFNDRAEAATDAATRSHAEIDSTEEKIETMLGALTDAGEAIENASDGITNVAEANDEQATAVEAVTASVEDVQERAAEMEAETDEIVAAIEQQNAAIEDLVGNVDQFLDDQ